MEIVVADANIFVYFFRCELLNIFLSNQQYKIKIAKAVLNEITEQGRRISREYPALCKIIKEAAHNVSVSKKLEVVDIDSLEMNFHALEVYYQLSDAGELDRGEIDSIPLALELNGRFISNDADAVTVANEIKPGLGVGFVDFCKEMERKCVFNIDELNAIIEFMKSY